MIITKERLVQGEIKNDCGVLRKKFLQLAEDYGFEVSEPFDWYDYDYIRVNSDLNEVDTSTASAISIGLHELTLEDFMLHENALQSPVGDVTLETHIHILEENKRSTGAPMPFIVEDGSVSDTRKDIFKEILTLARENYCFIQFDGLTEDEIDSIVVTFASSDDEYVVKSVDEFRELISSINTTQKFLRNQ